MSFAEAARPVSLRRANDSIPDPPAPRLRLRRVRPRDDLRASVSDGACVSAMVGLGETYFAAFALALGVSQTMAGLVATLPMLAGASLQLATPWFLQRVRSYKKWVVLFASLQAAALLAMPVAVCLSGNAAAGWIFLAASIYWAASQATGPAWNTWIEEIVPRPLRARFFSHRARLSQIGTLTGFALGGIVLQLGHTWGWLLAGFAVVFLLGAASRFLSARFLNSQSEPSRGRYQPRQVPMATLFAARRDSSSGGTLVVYLLAMQMAVQVSGPYFAPFMLAQERLSYASYMLLIGLSFFGKVLGLPLWGRVAQAGGARRLLWLGGIAIVPVAALWLGSDLFSTPQMMIVYLAAVQLVSGFVWAGYELAMQLMFFEAIPRNDRPCMLSYYNFGNAAAQVGGSLIGAAILQLGGESHGAYLAVFAGSSLLRLCTVPLLMGFQEHAKVMPTHEEQFSEEKLTEKQFAAVNNCNAPPGTRDLLQRVA